MAEDSIAKRLMKLRTAKKLTQEQVAELIRKDLRTVQNHEDGLYEPSAPTLKRYAELYGVHWFELKTGQKPPSVIEELPPLYGHTSEKLVEGKSMKITTFGDDEEPGVPPNKAVELLHRILSSNDVTTITAILTNLQAFASNLEKDALIEKLKADLETAERKLMDFRKKLDLIYKIYVEGIRSTPSEEVRLLLKSIDTVLSASHNNDKFPGGSV